ncbi:MAG: hypothetical protein ACKVYV_02140 [Limisphaerales bacterium]
MPRPCASLIFAVLLLLDGAGRAADLAAVPGGFTSTVSESGQFTVFGPRPELAVIPVPRNFTPDTLRDLTPATLAVAGERTKSRLLELLGQRDRWREGGGRAGKIFVTINPRLPTNAPPQVQAVPFERAWQYRLEMPGRVPEAAVIRGLVQALLLELANRASTGRCAEIPLWLLEGATQAVLAAEPASAIPQPDTRLVLEARRTEPLARARDVLSRRAPPDFDDLGLPDVDRMTAEDWEVFSAAAHLFFHELAALPDGRARLAPFVQTLPRYYNWQHAFLAVWPERFPTLLEAAKWWAIVVAGFTGRDEWQAWPPAVTLAKLDGVLRPPVWAAGATNAVAQFASLPLPELLETGDYARSGPALRRMLEQLAALRLRAARPVLPLVDEYRALVHGYLAERDKAGFETVGRGRVRPSYRLLMRAAADRARELDGRRMELVNQFTPPLAAAE